VATPEQSLKNAWHKLSSVSAELFLKLIRLTKLSYNMYSPDIFNRSRRDVKRLNDATVSLLSDIQQLIDLAKTYGVEVAPSHVSVPQGGAQPKLGTTVGDLTGLPGIPVETNDVDLAAQLTN